MSPERLEGNIRAGDCPENLRGTDDAASGKDVQGAHDPENLHPLTVAEVTDAHRSAGLGAMGAKLGTIFARAGHQVVFSYSRSDEKLKSLARRAKADARAGSPREAAACDAVLLAVNWPQVDDVLHQAHDLAGKVLLTCAVPMNEDNTELIIGRTSSGAEELVKKTRGAHVVSAFGTVPSEALYGVFRRRTHSPRPSLVYCGDDEAAKRVARGLIHDAGFDPVDVGPLRIARYTEPCALLVAQVAYEGGRPPEVAYRFERFPEED